MWITWLAGVGNDRCRDLPITCRHRRFDGRAVPAISVWVAWMGAAALEAGVRRVIVLGGLG